MQPRERMLIFIHFQPFKWCPVVTLPELVPYWPTLLPVPKFSWRRLGFQASSSVSKKKAPNIKTKFSFSFRGTFFIKVFMERMIIKDQKQCRYEVLHSFLQEVVPTWSAVVSFNSDIHRGRKVRTQGKIQGIIRFLQEFSCTNLVCRRSPWAIDINFWERNFGAVRTHVRMRKSVPQAGARAIKQSNSRI